MPIQNLELVVRLTLGPEPDGDLVGLVGRHPLLLGRGGGCDLAVRDPHVSRHHALFWLSGDLLHVHDLGSALGTRVGERKAVPGEPLAVREDEPVWVAERLALRWSRPTGESAATWVPRSVVARDGEHWQTHDGAAATVGPMDVGAGPTARTAWERGEEEPTWTLTVAFGPGGPRSVRFEHPECPPLTIAGEARVVLLYLLARQLLRYRRRRAESPWVPDRAIRVGLWGARAETLPRSRLNTLVARVRDQLAAAGLPRDILQKKSGLTRLSPGVGSIALQRNSSDDIVLRM